MLRGMLPANAAKHNTISTWFNICLGIKLCHTHTVTARHPASPYKQHIFTQWQKAICSQLPNFPLKLWNKFSFRTNIFCWSVMDSPHHFDPFVQQNENTIYHYLHHSDFLGGALFRCKNICALVTPLRSQALGAVLLQAWLQHAKVSGRATHNQPGYLLERATRNCTKTHSNC